MHYHNSLQALFAPAMFSRPPRPAFSPASPTSRHPTYRFHRPSLPVKDQTWDWAILLCNGLYNQFWPNKAQYYKACCHRLCKSSEHVSRKSTWFLLCKTNFQQNSFMETSSPSLFSSLKRLSSPTFSFMKRLLSSLSSDSERTFPPIFSYENVFKRSALMVLRAKSFIRSPSMAEELAFFKELSVVTNEYNLLSFRHLALYFNYVVVSNFLASNSRLLRFVTAV